VFEQSAEAAYAAKASPCALDRDAGENG
jgi:hypothetical protein